MNFFDTHTKVVNMSVYEPKIIEKPWGRELLLSHEKEYAGKILEVKKGERLSLQFHEVKKESMYVLEGKMLLVLGEESFEVSEGQAVTILSGTKHRIEALTDIKVIEFSTPELDDIVRIEDDYGRVYD
ncbi:MAG: cupin domain-containing protein [Candidatus Altiarchaeota archaeon]